jgi:fluoroacetyl-CoA thioesterase
VVDIPVGLRAEATLLVTEADTARAMGSGDVDVLATPRLVALCEQASCEALGGRLTDTTTTVGMRVQIDHLQPTPVGAVVTAEAVLERIEGRRLSFTVSVSDAGGLVAAGRLTRVVVDRERFLAKCCSTEGSATPA